MLKAIIVKGHICSGYQPPAGLVPPLPNARPALRQNKHSGDKGEEPEEQDGERPAEGSQEGGLPLGHGRCSYNEKAGIIAHRYDDRKTSCQRGYGYRWQKARRAYLDHNPLCVMCAKVGRVTEASVVDHIVPHRDNQRLFWGTANWQALCKPCHDGHKQSQEKGGNRTAVGADGWPVT